MGFYRNSTDVREVKFDVSFFILITNRITAKVKEWNSTHGSQQTTLTKDQKAKRQK